MIRVKRFPLPDKLLEVPENVLSVDLGRRLGFAFVKDGHLCCGAVVLKISEWSITSESLKQIKNEYEKTINYLCQNFTKFELVLLEENKFLLTLMRTKRGRLAHFVKLDMMVEGIFVLLWPTKIKRYFGGWNKKKNFCSGRQDVVQAKIKELLNTDSLSDHATDAIAGLYYMREKNGNF